jgi:putative aldouronate transport system permease protein
MYMAAAAPSRAGKAHPAFLRLAWKQKWLILFTVPGFLFFLVFSYTPMFGVLMAFQSFDPVKGFWGSPWVGLANFRYIFALPEFLTALKNTLVISFLKLAVGFPAGIVFALCLNEIRHTRFKRITQTLTYLPYFISWVIVAGLFYKLLSVDETGLVNSLLLRLGLIRQPIYFFGQGEYFYGIAVFTELWKGLGYGAIVYLAALAGVNPELYESATVDGAGLFRRMWHVSLPGIKRTIIFLLILSASSLMSAGFDQMWVMGNLTIRGQSEILDTLVLRTLKTAGVYGQSYGAAMGVFTSLTAFGLFLLANGVTRLCKEEALV